MSKISIILYSILKIIKKNMIKIYSKIMGIYFLKQVKKQKDRTFILGDSHSIIFANKSIGDFCNMKKSKTNKFPLRIIIKNIKNIICHLGPCTAYSLNNPNSISQGLNKTFNIIETFDINKSDTLILVFGEIDCRVHIKKQSELNNNTIEIAVDEVLKKYEEYINIILKYTTNIICYGPIASQPDCTNIDPDFPRYGSNFERNEITKLFNKKLELLCKQLNIKFTTIFFDMVDNNITKIEYVNVDFVHLSNNAIGLVNKAFYPDYEKIC